MSEWIWLIDSAIIERDSWFCDRFSLSAFIVFSASRENCWYFSIPAEFSSAIAFTELVSLPADEFHQFMKEIFAKTKKGKEAMKEMIQFILHEKEKDDFDAYLDDKNSQVAVIGDDECFLPEELDCI